MRIPGNCMATSKMQHAPNVCIVFVVENVSLINLESNCKHKTDLFNKNSRLLLSVITFVFRPFQNKTNLRAAFLANASSSLAFENVKPG